MSNHFNWETEDDSGWEETSPPDPTRKSPFRWPILVAVIITLGAAGWVIFRQVEQRLAKATANIEADIMSSHNLFRYAAANADLDLFRSLLSGRNPRWTETELDLAGKGWLFDREAFGLKQIPGEVPDPLTADLTTTIEDAAIDLSSDLEQAELVFRQDYDSMTPSGEQETVTLEHTAVYRRGRQRWLNAPLEEEFWGGWMTDEGAVLTLTYPARDQDISARLAGDLDHLLAEMCRIFDSRICPPGLQVQLRLVTNPSVLLDGHDLEQQFGRQVLLEMAAPTLVGLPVDEAGYQAVYRGYARQLITKVIAKQMNYTCCEKIVYFKTLVDAQLSELGLLYWPVTQQSYQDVVLDKANSDTLSFLWRRDELDDVVQSEIWQVYVLIEFLLDENPSLAVTDFQVFLQRNTSYFLWLENFLKLELSVNRSGRLAQSVNDGLWAYAFSKMVINQEQPPLPLPDQALYASCVPTPPLESTTPAILYRFQFNQPEWTALETMVNSSILMTPLANDSGMVVQEIEFDERDDTPLIRTRIWGADGRRQVLETEGVVYTLGQMDPAGKLMLVYTFDESDGLPKPAIIELETCDEGTCSLQEIAGLPHWSPDGTSAIMVKTELLFDTPMTINDSQFLFDPRSEIRVAPFYRVSSAKLLDGLDEAEPVAEGSAPFWIDEQTYGFIQANSSTDGRLTGLFSANIQDDKPERLVGAEELWQKLPADKRPFDPALLTLKYAVVHPANPDLIFIGAVNTQSYLTLFSFNRTTKAVQLRLATDVDGGSSIGFSPDGRFLVLTGFGSFQTQGRPGADLSALPPRQTLYLYDLADNTTQTIASQNPFIGPSKNYDWTADSQWLAVAVNNKIIDLIAPAKDYQQILPHNLGNCSSLAWITP